MSKSLQDAFLDELRDCYDAERQLSQALPKMARAATARKLKSAFEAHLEETKGQVGQLEKIFEMMSEKVRGKHCAGMAGIVEEGQSILAEDFDSDTLDACLIAAGQRAEHYEMAAYGTLVAWAETLDRPEIAEVLKKILAQEKAADQKLSALAEGGLNRKAATKYEDAGKVKSVKSVRS